GSGHPMGHLGERRPRRPGGDPRLRRARLGHAPGPERDHAGADALRRPGPEEQAMTVDVRGKWALVTGASRGVGKQIAARLVELGCNVVAHSRALSHTGPLVRELSGSGARVAEVAAELSDQGDVDRMLDQALAI